MAGYKCVKTVKGTQANIASLIQTLLGTLAIKVNTMPTHDVVHLGADNVYAVIVYEET